VHILAHYTLTPDEALRGSRAFKRLGYSLSMGAGAALTLLGLVSIWAAPAQRGMGVVMAFNGLLFLTLPEGILRWARNRRGSLAYAPMEVVFDDEGLTLRTEQSEGGLPWTVFTRIRRRSGFWIFRLSPSQAVLVPERALDAAAGAELAAYLRQRQLLKP